jgi:hypothetical protein
MIMRRVVSAVVTAVLASIGVLVVTGTPALAVDPVCRVPYTTGSWDAAPCVERRYTENGYQYRAYANLESYPSNCSTFRAILTFPDGSNYISTGAWACSKRFIQTEWAAFPGQTTSGARGKLAAYNSSSAQILSIQSPVLY